jgi:hypothetical protein
MDRNRGGTARRGRLLDTAEFRQHASDGRVVLVVVVETANASDSGPRTNIIRVCLSFYVSKIEEVRSKWMRVWFIFDEEFDFHFSSVAHLVPSPVSSTDAIAQFQPP